ncbi:MAG: hypothetical protein QXQ14_03745, partial [Candidatus Aenigmatarchaeota archaeon]
YVYPSNSYLLTLIFSSILLISLPGSLLVVSLYRIGKIILKDEKTSLISSLIFGFSTLIFPYSTAFIGYSLSSFLLVFSFYLFLKKAKFYEILSPILLALSILVELSAFLISLILLFFYLYSLRKEIKKILIFLLSFFFGLLPLLTYNILIFEKPIAFYPNFVDPKISPCAYGKTYWQYCEFERQILPEEFYSIYHFILLHLLIFPYRGLLIYNPVLIFSIIGFFFLKKYSKSLTFLSILIFISQLLLNASYSYWFGGGTFGPRYLLFSIPFLFLPFASYIKEVKNKKIIFTITLIISFISAFISILSTAAYWEGVTVYFLPDRIALVGYWYSGKKVALKFSELNPLIEHYLPAFIDNGPRSRIFEFLIKGEVPDIRDFKGMPIREIAFFAIEPFGILVLKVPFLILLILAMISFFIWKSEILSNKIFFSLFLVLIISLSLYILEIKEFVFENWHPLGKDEKIIWASNSSKIYVFSNQDKEVFLNVSFVTYRDNSVKIKLNNKEIGEFSGNRILEKINLKRGLNILEFIAVKGCKIPMLSENSSDIRCLGFGIKNFSLEEFLPSEMILGSNWYEEEKVNNISIFYASKNATIILPKIEEEVKLNITIGSYNRTREIKIIVNGRFVESYNINPEIKNIITPALILNNSVNLINIVSDCDIPAYIENSNDFRCISFFITNISLIKLKEILEKNITFVFSSGFYDIENGGAWMSEKGKIYLYSKDYGYKYINISFTGSPNRTLIVYLNSQKIAESKGNIIFEKVYLKKGENILELYSKEGCELEKSGRCLGFFIRNVSLIDNFSNFVFSSGFYDIENGGAWMSEKGKIYFNTNASIYISLYLTSYKKSRSIEIYANNKTYLFIIQNKTTKIVIPILEKTSYIDIKSKCDIPAFLENSSDYRCLSVFISKIDFSNNTFFDKNFFEEEKYEKGNFRWFSFSGKIRILVSKNDSYAISFDVWSYNRNRTLKILLDNNIIKILNISTSKTKVNLLLYLSEGEHIISFDTDSCEFPKNDLRCLSAAIGNFQIKELNLDTLDSNGFYPIETAPNLKFRWLSNSSEITIFSTEKIKAKIKIDFSWSYLRERKVYIYLNNLLLKSFNLYNKTSIVLPVELNKGENKIKILSSCDIPKFVENSLDDRCLSVAITYFDIT